MCASAAQSRSRSMRDRAYPRVDAARTRVLYVRSPAALKRLTLRLRGARRRRLLDPGHSALRRRSARQDRNARRAKYELLYPLLDIATTLDPYFNIAYRFGAIFLASPIRAVRGDPTRRWRSSARQSRPRPQKWQYYHDVGFVYYWRLHDYKAAARWFQRAATQPNAPNWLPAVAASMLTRSDDRRDRPVHVATDCCTRSNRGCAARLSDPSASRGARSDRSAPGRWWRALARRRAGIPGER